MIAAATYLFFSTAGRITRASWWIGVGALVVLNILLFFMLWSILGPSLITSFLGRLIDLCVSVFDIYALYCLSAKRFQDRDRSALNAKIVALIWIAKVVHDFLISDLREPDTFLLLFVFIGTGTAVWYFIELGLLTGTPGPNRYGEEAVNLISPSQPK